MKRAPGGADLEIESVPVSVKAAFLGMLDLQGRELAHGVIQWETARIGDFSTTVSSTLCTQKQAETIQS